MYFLKQNINLGIIIILISFAAKLHSQINAQRFEKEIHLLNGTPLVSKIVSTKDSGYCVFGNISKPGGIYHILITKLGPAGLLKWSYSYSLKTDSCINGLTCINTSDNGFIIGGNTSKKLATSSSSFSPFIAKIDSLGNPVWAKSYSFTRGTVSSIKESSDSTILIALNYSVGTNNTNILQRADKNGTVMWSKKLGHVVLDFTEKAGKNIQILHGGSSITLKQLDKDGNNIWEKKYNNTKWYYNAWKIDVNAFQETVVISDLFDSTGAFTKAMYVLKTNDTGNVIFSNIYSGDWMSSQTYAGGFTKNCGIMVNSRLRYFGTEKQGILILDPDGSVQWLKKYPIVNFVWARYLINTPDFGYASLGEVVSGSSVYSRIIKTDVNGKTSCTVDSNVTTIVTPNPLAVNSTLNPSSFITVNNAAIPFTQYINTVNVITHCFDIERFDSLKYCTDTLKAEIEPDVRTPTLIIPNVFTPNGDNFNDYFKINTEDYSTFEIKIYNRWGTPVFQSNSSLVSWNGQINNSNELAESGTYYYIIKTTDKSKNKKNHKGFLTLIR